MTTIFILIKRKQIKSQDVTYLKTDDRYTMQRRLAKLMLKELPYLTTSKIPLPRLCTSSNTDAFVWSVEAAPEPMCVVATDQQLCDFEHFCSGTPSSVLSVDSTFNLGPFYVTLITYHNLLVENEEWKSPNNAGACFDTSDKEVLTYSLFCLYSDSTQPQTSQCESIWYRRWAWAYQGIQCMLS